MVYQIFSEARVLSNTKRSRCDDFRHCETKADRKFLSPFYITKSFQNVKCQNLRDTLLTRAWFFKTPKANFFVTWRNWHSVPHLGVTFTILQRNRSDSRLLFGVVIFMEKKISFKTSRPPSKSILNVTCGADSGHSWFLFFARRSYFEPTHCLMKFLLFPAGKDQIQQNTKGHPYEIFRHFETIFSNQNLTAPPLLHKMDILELMSIIGMSRPRLSAQKCFANTDVKLRDY